MTEVMKEYEYKNKNGKSVNIKRKYTIDGASNKRKQRELDEFFAKNADRFTDNVKIKALLQEYNESHENKISYSMFYTKYRKLFGTKRERRNKADDKTKVDDKIEEPEEDEINDKITDDKINEEEEEESDPQDKILEAMRTRKMRGNASYLAFTATPKNATLEKFGVKQEDGSFDPFHLYSMKQAIEEGFILDVLANYTTYKSYYEIEKSIAENPLFDTARAQKKLKAYVEKHSVVHHWKLM